MVTGGDEEHARVVERDGGHRIPPVPADEEGADDGGEMHAEERDRRDGIQPLVGVATLARPLAW